MKSLRAVSITLLLGLLSLSLRAETLAELYLYTENYGGYNYSLHGRDFEHWREDIGGSSTDLVKAILAESGLSYRLRLRTWSVGYERTLERPNYGLFSTARTESREDLFAWIGPIAQYNWILFKYAGNDLNIESIDDLNGLRIGGYEDDAATLFLQEQGFTVSTLPNDSLNPQRLAHDQIDVWIASDASAYQLAEAAGFPDIEPALTIRTVDMYLAMNPQTDPIKLRRLQRAYERVMAQRSATDN
ncbi:substrate-binding periplasmic protein [Saccharospirillum mangrovi]|uniref:substrate-binding periplasmic protein n=1 Tax=Saccharospirillum mangrovi TaxID=2161747 RepID=UPI000D3CDE46|nr:transporter substrate-binding domain-containing protein [Saccharospirillum mangrovi]